MSMLNSWITGADGLMLLADIALRATLLLLLAAAATALLHRGSAALRHLVWCVAVLGVLALPLLSLVLPAWELRIVPDATIAAAALPTAEPAAVPETSPPPVSAPEATSVPAAVGAVAPGAASTSAWLPGLVVALALAGLLVGLLWLAAGLWGARRIGRRADAVRDPKWLTAAQEVADQLGLRRPVRVLRSRGPAMPATWGLLWPSVILPAEADRWTEERLRTVLAHEFAHVKRFDCLTQAAAQLACALLWWHPAVWYAARRLRVERERACDDLVLQTGARPSEYANQLLEIARTHPAHRLAAPALVSMAKPSQLESRLLWILDGSRSRTMPSRRAALLTVLLGFGIVAPLAAVKPVEAVEAEALEETGMPEAEAEVAPPAEPEAVTRPEAPPAPVAGTPSRPPEAAVDTPQVRRRGAVSEGDRIANEFIRMRTHGVTAEFIREMEAAGYPALSTDDLVRFRIHGVSPAFIREMERAGYPQLSPDQLVRMRIHGVSPAFVREMEAAGYPDLSTDDLVRFRIHGVSPAFVREMAEAGYGDLAPDVLVRMRIHGVNAALVRELREAGFEDLSLDTLVRLRISGVDRELIERGRRGGTVPR